jgi:pimeloyl-ACP methyl ester carboxylesterase
MPTYAGDEFAMLSENAADAGLEGPLPEVRRLAMNGLSALRWGAGDPEVVFLHGGAQNAHTWDTVIIALERPALAIDLPGHGHSAWRQDHDYSPRQLAAAVAPLVRTIAPDAKLVVGMSLGGLTAISLAATDPELVRRLAIVDVTPGANAERRKRSLPSLAAPPPSPASKRFFAARSSTIPPGRCARSSAECAITLVNRLMARGPGDTTLCATGPAEPGIRISSICGMTSPLCVARCCLSEEAPRPSLTKRTFASF